MRSWSKRIISIHNIYSYYMLHFCMKMINSYAPLKKKNFFFQIYYLNLYMSNLMLSMTKFFLLKNKAMFPFLGGACLCFVHLVKICISSFKDYFM